ncbi:MAG: NmrA/HSCARG family protein [Mycobacteriaceae bacterium]|nr:NmrA/HSCARG family protein [Mycobacteriaceae bacterium]
MSTAKGPVLVIGATGQQGRATTRHLLRQGWEVNAFVRSPQSEAAQKLHAAGAGLVSGDLDDVESVRKAMDGAYGVFLMLTMMEGANITDAGIAAETRRGTAAVAAAADSGVEHVVYTSLSGAGQDSGVPYYAAKEHIEAQIRAAALPATVLRPTFFMDNFVNLNRTIVQDSVLNLNLAVQADIPVQLISTDDIGAFAALAFAQPGQFRGRTVPIAGDRLTPPQIADTMGRVAGMPARSNVVPLDAVRAFDEHVARMFEFFNSHPDSSIDIDALRAAHPGLESLETWLRTTNWRP